MTVMLVCRLDASHALPEEIKEVSRALQKITLAVAKSKRAIVLVGAGISTSAGIPDFRGLEGIYTHLRNSATTTESPSKNESVCPSQSTSSVNPHKSHLKGTALFSASVYSTLESRAEHWKFLAEMKTAVDTILGLQVSKHFFPTPTHSFLKLISKRGQLRRLYTQNIDGLEIAAGLKETDFEGTALSSAHRPSLSHGNKGKVKAPGVEVVQLHGSIHRVRCTLCDYVGSWNPEHTVAFTNGVALDCPDCLERHAERARLNKRRIPCRSYLRPSVVLYSESSPASLSIGSVSISDLSSCPDLCLVMGTSLRIPGFKKLVKEFAKAVQLKGGLIILVNLEEMVAKEWQNVFDYQVVGTTDDFVVRIQNDWKRTRPNDWIQQRTLDSVFSVDKPGSDLNCHKGENRKPADCSLFQRCTANNSDCWWEQSDPPPRLPLQPMDINLLYPEKRRASSHPSEDVDLAVESSPRGRSASNFKRRRLARSESTFSETPLMKISLLRR